MSNIHISGHARLAGPYSTPVSTGGAGTSTATVTTPVRIIGQVVGIYVLYNDAPPAGTTDATIATLGTSPAPPTYNLLAIVNASTSGWFYPQTQIHTVAGAAIAAEYTPLLVHDFLTITIAGANDGDSLSVWFLVV